MWIGIFICDDWDQVVVFFGFDWDFYQFVDDGGIVGIVGMYCDCVIVQYGFGLGCCDVDIVVGFVQGDVVVFVVFDIFIVFVICQWVFEMLYMVGGFVVFDFKIGNCGFEMWVLVDQMFVVIDQVFVIYVDKDFDDGIVEIVFFVSGCIWCVGYGEGIV